MRDNDLFPIPVAAEVRPAEDLAALAKRVRDREKKSRKEQLEHVKKQAADVLTARTQAKRGQWKGWCEEAGLGSTMAWNYLEFGKLSVTESFSKLTEDQQWAEWQRICGNAPPANEPDEAEPPPPEYVTLEQWTEAGKTARAKLLRFKGEKTFNDQGKNDNIEWALWSWNPVTGCLHDCPYCYARDIAERFYDQKFVPSLWPDRLAAPQNTTFPEEKIAAELARETEAGRIRAMGLGNVFVCSMADLFGRWVPEEWINAVLEQVRAAPQWNFLFLTKFPIRMSEFEFPDNAWVGTTVDCQARVKNAEKAFRKVRAGVKWLSCEPLIEPLEFEDLGAFQWVVIGGASQSAQTPEWYPPRAWVRSLEDEADRCGVRVYFKTNLRREFRRREYPGVEVPQEETTAPEALRYLPNPDQRA